MTTVHERQLQQYTLHTMNLMIYFSDIKIGLFFFTVWAFILYRRWEWSSNHDCPAAYTEVSKCQFQVVHW